jgi:prepilin-type N-terminal cleavage/methylation domain-containing protein
MRNRNFKPELAVQDGHPFICHKVPFVCFDNPPVRPFICKNMPFIGLGSIGFTLVELIVTITIVGILAALAAPAITTLIANQRLSSQANDLLSDLTFSRSEAIKRASGTTGVTICKTADPNAATPDCNTTAATAWTAGRIVFIDNNADGVRDAGDEILRIRQELEGATPGGNKSGFRGHKPGSGI